MRIAVTGASGFVGRHVTEQLRRLAMEIVLVTRDATKLQGLGGAISVVEWDIADVSLECFERLGRPDTLIHLAWDGLPNYSSMHHFETELGRQYRFLKGLVAAGLRSVLVTGTCAEYGMQTGALSEDMPARPAHPYGYAKNALRRQLEFLQTVQPFALTWMRLFYMYGDGQSEHSLLSQLRKALSRGDKTFDMSGGEQLRDYLPVREVARLIVSLALHHSDAGVVNICAGAPVSVRRLVEQWIRENDWEIGLNLGRYPYPDYESMAFWGSRSKLDSLLGNS